MRANAPEPAQSSESAQSPEEHGPRSAAPGPRGSELSEPAEALVVEPWDIGSSEPLPAKALYAVRVVLLIAPALGMVYFFMRAALFPVGAVPLVYLVVQGWLATIYRADRSVMLIYWGNAVSALLAAVMGVFFAYLLLPCTGRMRSLNTSGHSTREPYLRSWGHSCWSFSSRCSTRWFCAG